MSLSKSQKHYLRGLAHALKPVIMIGNKGVTEAVLKELSLALDHHELIKVKLGGEDHDARNEQIAALVAASKAQVVQSIGHVISLYRQNAEQIKIALPK